MEKIASLWPHSFYTDEDYIRKKFRDMDASTDQSLKGLMWDSAQVRKVKKEKVVLILHIPIISFYLLGISCWLWFSGGGKWRESVWWRVYHSESGEVSGGWVQLRRWDGPFSSEPCQRCTWTVEHSENLKSFSGLEIFSLVRLCTHMVWHLSF